MSSKDFCHMSCQQIVQYLTQKQKQKEKEEGRMK
jgi:hypothetical protein